MSDQENSTTGDRESAVREAPKKQNKLLAFLNDNFGNIFSKEHWIYTLTFFIAALVLAILHFFVGSAPLIVGLYISTTLLLAFALLFIFSNLKATEEYILGKNIKKKALTFAVFGLISLGLCIVFFLLSKDLPQLYQYDISLPWIYIITFFGWNVIQIFFIRKGFEDISSKTEEKVFTAAKNYKEMKNHAGIWLIIGILVPIAVHVLLLVYLFANPAAILDNLVIDVFGQMILVAWVGGTSIAILLASLYIYMIHKASVKHETPSVFGPLLHVLFWLYIAYKSYSFINSAGKSFVSQDIPIGDQIIDSIIMVLALLLLFRGLGKKLSRVSILRKKNIPFLAYAFATIVIMGKVSLLIGVQTGTSFVQVPQAIISAVNALMEMAVAILFYFTYLKKRMAQKDYLERDTYSVNEVAKLFDEFTGMLVKDVPGIDKKATWRTLDDYLYEKEITESRRREREEGQLETSIEPPIQAKTPVPTEKENVDDEETTQEPDDNDTG